MTSALSTRDLPHLGAPHIRNGFQSIPYVYFASDNSDMKTELKLLIQNRLSYLVELTKKADGFMESHHLPIEIVYKVHLILEEVLTNIIKYAYEDTLKHDIKIEMILKENELVTRIRRRWRGIRSARRTCAQESRIDFGECYRRFGYPSREANGRWN